MNRLPWRRQGWVLGVVGFLLGAFVANAGQDEQLTSPAGRGVAVVLMIAGIAMFGVITATIAAYFVEQKAEEDLAGRLDQIMERLDRIETRLPNQDEQPRERARR